MWVLIYAMCTYGNIGCVSGEVSFQTKQLCDDAISMMQTITTVTEQFHSKMVICVPKDNNALESMK